MKNITLLFCALIIGTSVFGQARGTKSVNVFAGVEIGFMNTWLFNPVNKKYDEVYSPSEGNDNDTLSYNGSFGIDYGLFGQYYFTDKIGVELGLNYHGVSQKYHSMDWDWDSELSYSALSIPVLARFGEGGYFEIGVATNIMLGANYSRNVTCDTIPIGSPLVIVPETSVKNDFNTLAFDAIIGFGGTIEITNEFSMDVGLRLSYGISDLGGVDGFKNNKDLSIDPGTFKTTPFTGGLQISGRYLLK